MRYIYYFLFIIAFLAQKSEAQIDTSFWFVAPNISSDLGDNPVSLHIKSYNNPTTVLIRQPANGAFTPISFSMPANSYSIVVLTASLSSIENTPANTVLNKGIYISTSNDVSITYKIEAASNKESISLKGQKAIGIDFYTPFQNLWKTAVPTSTNAYNASAIDIVAIESGTTTVLITPRANLIGPRAKNVSFTVALQQGQTFSCQDTSYNVPTTLAGSIVSANKKVAVTVSSGGLVNAGCRSIIADQITNSSYAGTDFVINRGNTGVDKVFILATLNSTSITVNNGSQSGSLINTGETYTVDINQPLTYIKTTKPVYVLHVTGYGCKLSGAQVPNFYCMGTYSTAFTRTSSDSFALNLYVRNGFQSSFLLNGSSANLPSSTWTVVPGTSNSIVAGRFYFNTSQVPAGTYNLLTNSADIFGCGVSEGSTTSGSRYHYINDFSSAPFVEAGPATATICSNTTYTLSGFVGGGNVTGVWSTTGFGTFAAGSTALSNTYIPSPLDTATAIKPIKLVLTSTGPCSVRRDTIRLYVDPAPLVNASVDQVKCGNNATITLNGDVAGFTTTGQWSTLGGGSFVPTNTVLNGFYIPSSSDTAAGSVKLVLTSTNNGFCLAVTDTMKITFTKPPHVDAGPANATLCSNNPTLALGGLVSGSSTTGKWTTSGTGVFTPNNLALNGTYIPSSLDISTGTVTLRLASTNNGNCLVVTDSLILNFTVPPNVNAGPSLYSCKNSPDVVLNGIVNGATSTGIWSGGTGTFTPSNTVLNATYTPSAADVTAGFVILNLTSTNNGNCLAVSSQVQIDFKEKPIANFAASTVCQKKVTQFLDGSNGVDGPLVAWNWAFGDGAVSTASSTTHTYGSSGNFNATLIVRNSFNCYDTISKTVTVYGLPTSNFTYNRSCFGSALQINFQDSSYIANPDTVVSYFYDYGGLGTSTQKNPIQVFPFQGTYNITHIVTSNNGCRDTIIKPITITPRPKAGFYYSNNSGYNLGSNVAFIDSSKNAVNWYWDFGDGNTSVLQNPNNVYFANGTFTVMQIVKDQFGCPDTAKSYIKIINTSSDITQLIPNAISPNGDGKNDVWRLDFINAFYPNAVIEIYNRWGERLFYSVGYNNAWDGTYKGDPLPVATYYYIINLNQSGNAEEDIYKGPILLIK